MKWSLRKLAAMSVPTDREAEAEAGEESFTEDNPTGSGATKCKRCSYTDPSGSSSCPNCGSYSMRKVDNGKQVNHSSPQMPDNRRIRNQDKVFSFFRGQAAIKHGPTDDTDSWD